MNTIYNTQQKSKLQEVLAQCNRAGATGYKEAIEIMRKIEASRDQASNLLNQSIKEMKKHGVNDPKTYEEVYRQMKTMEAAFNDSVRDAQEAIERKRRQTDSFNIVLFGQTKCGKSTLMEILTHGNGSSIGKGAQRTTRDIRTYRWEGMTVTDVPGIGAYGGQQDEEIALEAARNADLIIFMITAGQPGAHESDWLVRLKKMDKPVICLCNVKRSIADQDRMEDFLNNTDKVMDNQGIKEIIQQFNEFVQQKLPNEHIPIFTTHLLAKFRSMQETDRALRKRLEKASRFDFVEKCILEEVITNGLMHRKRSYLSIVGNTVYTHYMKFIEYCTQSLFLAQSIKDNIASFDTWKQNFNRDKWNLISSRIVYLFDQLRQKVPGFVEDNYNNEYANHSWNSLYQQQDIPKKVEKLSEDCYQQALETINEKFSNLGKEFKMTLGRNNSIIQETSFTNWKKINQWTSAITGSIATVAFFFSGPIGWIFTSISLLFGLFGWGSKSRAEKARRAMNQLSGQLQQWIDKAQSNTLYQARKSFRDNINYGLERVATDRFYILRKTMLTQTNSQRLLGWDACQIHKTISKKLIKNILEEIGMPQTESAKVIEVARVPGKMTLIVVSDFMRYSPKASGSQCLSQTLSLTDAIKKKLGSGEKVQFIQLRKDLSLQQQMCYLLKNLHIDLRNFSIMGEESNERRCQIRQSTLSDRERDNLNLIQQLLQIHMIHMNSGSNTRA